MLQLNRGELIARYPALEGWLKTMDIPVLNDFIVGYIQGATDTVPDTKVAISVIGDFNDTAKAKDLATAQFNLGSSVAFNVAAQAGLGMATNTDVPSELITVIQAIMIMLVTAQSLQQGWKQKMAIRGGEKK